MALGLGLAVGALAAVRDAALAGTTIAARYALRAGIALLGARLTLGQVLETGAVSAVAIVITVATALLLATWFARRLDVRPPLSALVTVGMAICGNSAILALAPIVRAPHRETAYAVSTITIFGLIAVLALPIAGHLLGLTDATFGTWAGLAVNDTAQVVATGFAYSPPAGEVATIVKLTRNLTILPVLLGATWLAVRDRRGSADAPVATRGAPIGLIARAVPWFVVAFVGFAALRSIGALDGAVPTGGTLADLCSTAANLLILLALAGVGLATDVRAMLGVGHRPFLLGAAIWTVITFLALGLSIAVTDIR